MSKDYDDEDEERDNARYKKRRNERHGGFILEEAEVDDEVESEDEWEDGAQEVGIVDNDFDEHGPTAQDIEGRRRGTTFWEYVSETVEIHLRFQRYGKLFFIFSVLKKKTKLKNIYVRNTPMNLCPVDISAMEVKICLMKLLSRLYYLVSSEYSFNHCLKYLL